MLDAIDIRALTLAELWRALEIVSQEPALFSGAVRENIACARPDAAAEEFEAAANVANAGVFIVHLPEQYDTLLGEPGVKLSGGRRRRIAIARAMLKDPSVLVLDMASSSLDNESERLVELAVSRLLVGRTTPIIPHRLSTVQRADRLVVLDAGAIVEEGTHASPCTGAGSMPACSRCTGAAARTWRRRWRH